MPYSVFVDKDRRLVVTTAADVVTLGDIASCQDALMNDPDFDSTFRHLVDAAAATRISLSSDDAAILASRDSFSPKARCAFLRAKPAITGMGLLMRVHHAMETGRDLTRVFTDRDSAMEWLGLAQVLTAGS
jgi:hypothetical protein